MPIHDETFFCPVCLDGINGGLNRPLCLPCGHTMCKECLGSMRARCCPCCRAASPQPVSALPTNQLVLQAVECSSMPIRELLRQHSLDGASSLYLPGATIQLSEPVARGRTTSVWRAVHQTREVAVKLVHTHIPSGMCHDEYPFQDAPELKSFCREFAMLVKAAHDCMFTCKVYGFTVLDGQPGIVMKFYKSSLAAQIPAGGIGLHPALRYGTSLVKALAEVHSLGIVVADLKPENVLFNDIGDLVLGDFGMSRIVNTTLGAFTSSSLQESMQYMSPEQFGDGRVTARCDVWAWACVFVFMLTGTQPWHGLDVMQITVKVAREGQCPTVPVGLPTRLHALLQDCLKIDALQRPTSQQVADELVQVAAALATTSLASGGTTVAQGSAVEHPGLTMEPTAPPLQHGYSGHCTSTMELQLPDASGTNFTLKATQDTGMVIAISTKPSAPIGDAGLAALARMAKAFPHLLVCDLASSTISNKGAEELAHAGAAWPALQQLLLNHNSIGNEGVEALTKAARNWPQLRVLAMKANRICASALEPISWVAHHWPLLAVCDLSNNPLGDQGVAQLVNALNCWRNLQQLHLQHTQLNAKGVRLLVKAAAKLQMLTHWNLQGNKLGSDGAQVLAAAAAQWPCLSVLELSGNGIGTRGAAALAQSSKEWPGLLVLQLDKNRLGSDGMKALLSEAACWQKLTHLYVGSNSLGDKGAKYIAKAASLGSLPSLQVLAIARNGISAKGLAVLAEASGSIGHQLVQLDVSKNTIGNRGATALLGAPCYNWRQMQVLKLDSCGLGDDGSKALAHATCSWAQLLELHVADNGIEAEGITALLRAASYTKHLRVLVLDGNRIGTAGAKAFLWASRDWQQLQHLSASTCSLGKDGVEVLSAAVRELPQLQYLDVSNNYMSDAGAQAIITSCVQGCQLLLSLNLANNKLGASTAKLLADQGGFWLHLTHLTLDNNGFTDHAMAELVQASLCWPSLQYLHY